MTAVSPAIIQIKPTSSRIAWIIAGTLGVAGILFTGDGWRTTGSPPAIYLLIFGLPTALFALLAWLTHSRALTVSSDALRETAWKRTHTIPLQELAGLSLRVSIYGRLVTRQLVFWSASQREDGQVDITDYTVAQIRRVVAQLLVQSPHLQIDRELQRYLNILPPSVEQ